MPDFFFFFFFFFFFVFFFFFFLLSGGLGLTPLLFILPCASLPAMSLPTGLVLPKP